MRTWTRAFLPPGTAPLDKHEVLLSINADKLKVLDRNALCAHVTIHVKALTNACRVCALTNGHWTTLVTRTVSHWTAREVPALNGTLETLTLTKCLLRQQR